MLGWEGYFLSTYFLSAKKKRGWWFTFSIFFFFKKEVYQNFVNNEDQKQSYIKKINECTPINARPWMHENRSKNHFWLWKLWGQFYFQWGSRFSIWHLLLKVPTQGLNKTKGKKIRSCIFEKNIREISLQKCHFWGCLGRRG